MKCEHCGAVLAATALECNYCQAPTAAGFRARQQAEHAEHERRRWADAQAHHARSAGQSRLDSLSTQSMWISIGGTLICCWPIAGLGLVQGLRARGLARTLGTAAPFGAQVGLGLGILGILTSIGGWSAAIIGGNRDTERAHARIADLEQQSKAGAAATILPRDAACALAEAHALKVGFDGHTGPTLHDFECMGKVTGDGERATLDTFRFKYTSTRYETNVCFKRGAQWYVGELGKESCDAPAAAVSGAPTSTSPRKSR